MDPEERKLSKLYRRLLTANEVKAILVFEKLDDHTKERVRKKCIDNGSTRAISLLSKFDKLAQ